VGLEVCNERGQEGLQLVEGVVSWFTLPYVLAIVVQVEEGEPISLQHLCNGKYVCIVPFHVTATYTGECLSGICPGSAPVALNLWVANYTHHQDESKELLQF